MLPVSSSTYSPLGLPQNTRPIDATDFKIFNTVVLGQILTELGALIALTSAVCTAFVTTQFAIGIAVGVIAIAAGSIMTGKAPELRLPIPTAPEPFVPGQPVGIENESANCWANSVLQFLFNVPNLRGHIKVHGPSVVKNAIKEYDQTRTKKHHVAENINSQDFRNWIAGQIRGISRDAGDQEDAHEALTYLLRNLPPIPFEVRRTSRSAHADEPWRVLTLSLHEHARANSLEQLFDRNFLAFHDAKGGGTRRFRDCPNGITFHFARFGMKKGQPNKINSHLNIGSTFSIPAAWTTSRRSANYDCQAFIEHIGGSIDGGHYVSYVKIGRQWWCCDDSTISKISTSEAEDKIGDSYIAYYGRA